MKNSDFKRNVFVLGAGFSKAANGLLMNDFFDGMQACFFSDEASPVDKECFESSLRFREEMAKASDNFIVNLDNLEDLFGLLEVKLTAAEKSEDDKRKFVLAILRTLEMHIWDSSTHPAGEHPSSSFPSDSVRASQSRLGGWGISRTDWLYHAFASMVGQTQSEKGKEDSIITFNYDLVLDRAFCELGYPVNYHLESPGFSLDYHSFTRTASPHEVALFKLHGSANWFRCTRHKSLYIAPPRLKAGEGRKSLLYQSLASCPRCDPAGHGGSNADDHIPLIVPPTWNKAAYQSGLQSVWSGALKALEAAGRIIVIGFSLPDTDLFFRFLLTAGISVGKGVEFWVFDPDKDAADRYQRFLSPMFKQNRFVWHGNQTGGGCRGYFDRDGLQCVSRAAKREV